MNKVFFKNLLFSFITLIMLFVIWLKYLDIYTHHNQYIKLPSFNGVYIDDLDSIFKKNNLRYVIIDSIFDKSKQRGIVVNQDPESNTEVKNNRKIYLTINFLKNRKVNFPDIYDLTLRQAIRILKKNGLKVGDLEYRKDIATNKVLGFKINGLSINVGQDLFHGTAVDLVLGRGLKTDDILVPNLVGLTRFEANMVIRSKSLNVGDEYFRSGITDSSSAIVYTQYPEPINKKRVNFGSAINLYFRKSD